MIRPTRIVVASETGAPNRALAVYCWPGEGHLHIDASTYDPPWNTSQTIRLDLATATALRDALIASIEACEAATPKTADETPGETVSP